MAQFTTFPHKLMGASIDIASLSLYMSFNSFIFLIILAIERRAVRGGSFPGATVLKETGSSSIGGLQYEREKNASHKSKELRLSSAKDLQAAKYGKRSRALTDRTEKDQCHPTNEDTRVELTEIFYRSARVL